MVAGPVRPPPCTPCLATHTCCIAHLPFLLLFACPPQVEKKLLKAGVVQPPAAPKDDSDDEGAQQRGRTLRVGAAQLAARQRRTESDEDSDFD